MRSKVVIVLAEGFEEMEAVISIDMLRRAGIEVLTAALDSQLLVKGSRNISIQADKDLKDIDFMPDAVILPGGILGAVNLENSELVLDMVRSCFKNNKIIAAICASPAYILLKAGVLNGRSVTCYPGHEERFPDEVKFKKQDVVIDGNIITSAGPGTGFDFALAVIKYLSSEKIATTVAKNALVKTEGWI